MVQPIDSLIEIHKFDEKFIITTEISNNVIRRENVSEFN